MYFALPVTALEFRNNFIPGLFRFMTIPLRMESTEYLMPRGLYETTAVVDDLKLDCLRSYVSEQFQNFNYTAVVALPYIVMKFDLETFLLQLKIIPD